VKCEIPRKFELIEDQGHPRSSTPWPWCQSKAHIWLPISH